MNRVRTHDVVIVGGGNGGVSAAARLRRRGITDIAIVEPQAVHTYRPLLSYVGSGQARQVSAERTQRSVTPAGCSWVRDEVVGVEPGRRLVRCASGATLRYRDLILAPGLVVDHDALSGVDAAVQTASVTSNYLDRAEKTWHLVQTVPSGGHAIFTVPRAPVSCTGTTLKPLFLAASYWERAGRDVRLTLVVDRPDLIGVPAVDGRLHSRLRELGVRTLLGTTVTELHPARREIGVVDNGGTVGRESYDMLHLVPPFRAPHWIADAGLADSSAAGLVAIDPTTLRHRCHVDIWAAGDGAAVDTDPSGGALRRQTAVLVDNLVAARRGGEVPDRYDGYTVAPIATDAHKLIAAEFDRYGRSASALPSVLDPFTPRRSAWVFDRYALPVAYWKGILRGRL